MDFSHLITDNVREACNVIRVAGGEARIAGGAVRDALMCLAPKDIDLATTLPPDVVVDIFNARGYTVFPFGIKHGTVGVVVNGETIEITTLRVDRECDGRHAEVEFTSDWKLDAERRDFTFNAMFVDIDGNLWDYFGGQHDLENKLVRFVGNADARIKEDYLRILRYFRFFGRIGSNFVDTDAGIAIEKNLDGLPGISGERIWMEMQKIFTGPTVANVLTSMRDRGVLYQIGLGWRLEPITAAVGSKSSNPVTVLAAGIRGDKELAEYLIEEWKLSNEEGRLLRYLTSTWHQYRFPRDVIPHEQWWRDQVIRLQHASNRDPAGEKQMVIELAASTGQSWLVDSLSVWVEPKFPVTGRDLEDLGLTPGPDFGRILEMLRTEWTQSGYVKPKSELLGLVQNLSV